MKYIVTIRFMDVSSNTPKGSNYDYLMEDTLVNSLINALDGSGTQQFTIATEEGNNYRGSPIIFTAIRVAPLKNTANLKTIRSINHARYFGGTMLRRYEGRRLYSDEIQSLLKQQNLSQSSSMASLFEGLSFDDDRENNYKQPNTTKENNSMDNTMFSGMMKNMKFGPYKDRTVRLSMQGMAVKTPEGRYNAYDAKTGALTDVTEFLMDGFGEVFYVMPVAQKDVAAGDVIFHNNSPVIVARVGDSGLTVIDPSRGEELKKLPTKNVFGLDFYSKLVNVTDSLFKEVNPDQPFGKFPMLMLMQGNKNSLMKTMIMSQMFGGMGTMNGMNGMNPFMMAALMGNDSDGEGDDMLSTFALMSMMQNGGTGMNLGNMFSATPAPAMPSPTVPATSRGPVSTTDN